MCLPHAERDDDLRRITPSGDPMTDIGKRLSRAHRMRLAAAMAGR